MTDLTDTIFLHKKEAERLFAGAAFLDGSYARQECGWLSASKVSDEHIRVFWDLVKNGTDPDKAAMDTGIYYDILEYTSRVPTSMHIAAYAQTISTDAYLIESASLLPNMARAITARDERELRKLAQAINDGAPETGYQIPTAVDVGLEFQTSLESAGDRSEITGVGGIDIATGGFEKQTMTVIAARPSMGKSALGIDISRKRARCGRNTMLFTLEMSRRSVWARMACGDAGVDWRTVRSGKATPEQIEALKAKSADLIDELSDRLLIDDTSRMTMDEIWRRVSRYRPELVIIDHLGLIKSDEQNEVKALGDISWMGKIMAKEFDIPVIFLYQLNRGTESRDNKRPTMADLRGSGKIEENADNVMFLYRPDYYDPSNTIEQATTSKVEVIIGKFRDGARNLCVNLYYDLKKQTFFDETRRLP